MKQISLILNVVLLVAIAYLLYLLFGHPKDKNTTAQSGDKSTDCIACSDVFDGVLAKNFGEVVARYRDTHWDVINKDANNPQRQFRPDKNTVINGDSVFEDSRFIWFSLDTIKKFICYVEKYSDSIGVANNTLGIRFYYAVYPGSPTDDFSSDEYAGRFGQHTLYMVPTKQENGETRDFDPKLTYDNRQNNSSDSSFVFLDTLLSNPANANVRITVFPPVPKKETSQLTSNPPPNSFYWNNGKLCPTNCPTSAFQAVDASYPHVDYKE